MKRNSKKKAACFILGLFLMSVGSFIGNDVVNLVGCTFLLASLLFF